MNNQKRYDILENLLDTIKIKNIGMKSPVFIECECGSHVLGVLRDSDEPEPNWYFAMYSFGQRHRTGFLRRLRVAWKFLRTGETYADQIILKDENMEQLRKLLNSELNPDECDATDDASSNADGQTLNQISQ